MGLYLRLRQTLRRQTAQRNNGDTMDTVFRGNGFPGKNP